MSDSRSPLPPTEPSPSPSVSVEAPTPPSEWLRAELGALSAMLPPRTHSGEETADGGAGGLLPALQAALGEGLALERELGGGGMSRVFVAMDTTLGRRVAVKVLAPELLQGVSADRFAREVALAARLQDPHIVPVLTTGATAGGIPYYTMPFIEGESLRGRVQRAQESEVPVPLDEALRILRDVAEALEYAHARGVVHRDIKPENVLLSGRNALVADFGIAKAMTVARDAAVRDSASHGTSGRAVAGGTLTSVGLSLGTPGYMAPEQAGGDAVDHRADLYAWGLMAWELLAGRHPFADKQSSAQLMAAQLAEMPRPLDEVRPGLPPSLGALVMRCVAKLPAERPADIAAVLAALGGATTDFAITSGRRAPVSATPRNRAPMLVAAVLLLALVSGGAWWALGSDRGVASAAVAMPSIAVLPFEHQGDTANTYLTDGITDEIRNKLTGVPNLVVIARASSMQYKGKNTSPQEIAKDLGVRWLLTGTVRVIGEGDQRRVLVRPELVEVTSDGRLQSKGGTPFDGALTDVVKAQGEVASQVVSSMEVAVGGTDRAKLAQVATRDPVAYDLYLRGLAETNGGANGDGSSLRRAIALYEQAVARDSTMVDAWVALASAAALSYSNATPTRAIAAKARDAAARALALDPAGAGPHRAEAAYLRLVREDLTASLAELRRARSTAPSDERIIRNIALTQAELGQFDAALRDYTDAISLDPRSAVAHSGRGRLSLRMRRIAEARASFTRAAALAPTSLTILNTRMLAEVAAGDLAGARRVLDESARALPRERLVAYTATYWDMGWTLTPADERLLLDAGPEAFEGGATQRATVRAQQFWWRGDSAAARAWGDSALAGIGAQLRDNPNDKQRRILEALMLAHTGRGNQALARASAVLADVEAVPDQRLSAGTLYLYYVAARAAVIAGDRSLAIAWLGTALERRFYATPAMVRLDPSFAPLKGDAAFERVLAEAP